MNATMTKGAGETTATAINRQKMGERELNATDRCDRCGPTAPAYVRFWKAPFENELLFCNHHAQKFRDELISQGFDYDDQSKKLYENTKPMSGSNMAD